MDQKYIYLVFTKTGTWLSRLIMLFSHLKYPHASLSIDDSFTKMYSFGRINPNNPFSGGFVEEDFTKGVYKKFPGCQCLIYKVAITEEQFSVLEQQIQGFVGERKRYRYNFLGLFSLLLDKPLKIGNRYFCSQFVAEVLIKSGIFQSEKVPELIRTDELYKIPNQEVVYEGSISDFVRAKKRY